MSKPTPTRVLFMYTLRQFMLRVFVASVALAILTSVYSITRGNVPAVEAAAPNTLNFQARLMNASGSLVPDGYYNIEFKLYNTSTGGSALWTETRYDINGVTAGSDNRVEVRNGYLSAYLGDTSALPTNIWDQQLWLTMNIGGAAQTATPSYDGEMNPRIRLTSVPYAFRATVANSAETLSKNTGSFTGTVDFGTLTADRRYLFPDTSLATTASPGTICVYNGLSSNCPAASGSAYYIQNDTVVQTQTNFNIQARDSSTNGTVAGVLRGAAAGQTVDLMQFQASNGTVLGAVTAAGNLQVATSLDTRSAGTLTVGGANATAVSIGDNGVVTTVEGSLTVTEAADFNANVEIADGANLTVGDGDTTLGGTLTVTSLATFNGGITSNGNLVVAGTGNVAFQRNTTDYTAVGVQDDVNFGTGALFRLSGASTQTITSIAGGADGRMITIINAGANAALLQNDNGGTVANRIITGTGATLSIPSGSSVSLVYDSSAARWRVVGSTATSGGGANQQLSNLGNTAINTSLNPDSDNVYDLGTSALGWRSLYANTSVLSPLIGRATAGTLSLGTDTNSTAVSISRTGVTTTVNGALTVSELLTGNAGVTVSGGAISLTGNAASSLTTTAGALTLTSDQAATWSTTNGNLTIQAGSGTVSFGTTTALTANGQLSLTSGGVSTLELDTGGGAALNIGTGNANAVSISRTGVTTTINGALTVTEAGQFNGGLTSAGNLTVTNAGNVAFQRNTTDYTAVGAQDDVNFGTGVLFRITSGAALTINGIAGGTDGRVITLANASGFDVTFGNTTSGTAAHNIVTGTGNALIAPAGSTLQLAYDSASAVWRVVGGSATSGGGANQQLSNLSGTVAINASLTPNAANTLDLGSSSFAWRTGYFGTSVVAPSLDTVNAAALNIGTGNANAVSISRTGVTTTINGALTVTEAGQFNGGLTSAGNLTVTNAGNVAFQRNTTDYTAVGAQDDVNFGTGVLFRLNPASALAISSIAGGVDGRIITLVNASAVTVTLTNDAGGTAANRIITGTGGDIALPSGATVQLAYDSNANRWRILGTTAASGGAGVNAVGTFNSATAYANGAMISGTTLTFGAADATNPGMVTAANQTFGGDKTFNGSVTLAANQTIRLVGGSTALRPVTPTEGMLYFDTDTKQLLIYANGKWQADRSDSIIVAASNSSEAAKASADFVTDGENSVGSGTGTIDGDQIEINNALNAAAAAGAVGKVVLLAGTYTIDAPILVPNNVALTGNGAGTVVQLGNFGSTTTTFNMIENLDQTTGTGVTIQDLKLDGRNDRNTSGTVYGVSFTAMGAGTGTSYAADRAGAKVNNLWIERVRTTAMYFNNSFNNTISGNTLRGNGGIGLFFNFGSNNTATNNIIMGNSSYGVYLSNAQRNAITGNVIESNSSNGIFLNNSNNNLISSNKVYNNGGSGALDSILLTNSDANSITSNRIVDTSGSGHAISVTSGTSNYLADNYYSGTGATTINNAGTTTIYGGQQGNGGNYLIQTSGTIELLSNTNVTGTLNASTSVLTPTVDTATATTLSLGTTTASAVSISRTGVTTTVNGALAVTQGTTLSGGLTVTAGGNVAFQRNITDITATGTQTDLAIGTGALFRITSASALTINSIAGGSDGRLITLVNASSNAVTITNDTGTTAANRILTGTGASITVPAGASIQLAYDSGSSRWRVIGATAAANGYIQLQSGTPGTAQVGNFNINGTGIAATSLLTPTLDTPSGTTTLNIGTTNATAGINLNQSTTVTGNIAFAQGADRTLGVNVRSSNAAGNNLTISAGNAGTGAAAFGGGGLTLQGGAAAGTGNANGGSITIAGGAGVGTGTQGLVNLSTTAFTSSAVQTYNTTGLQTLATNLINSYSTIPVFASVTGVTVSVPDPAQNTVIGRVLYISARDASLDFTLRLNAGSAAPIDIAMKKNSTATLIWNGDEWTAAGASSSTDLQSAYNNTLTSAGGAEILLNPVGGAADGFTIRNNGTTPIIGGLLEVQNSVGSNLFSVNNNATEYAVNGGAENAVLTGWSAAPSAGGTVSRWTTIGDYVATGQASVQVVTTAANQGAINTFNTALTSGVTYSVSFAVRSNNAFPSLEVMYSPNGTTTGAVTCITAKTVTQGAWTRVQCNFVASGSITAANGIIIRQTDATARSFYVDNLSVNVNANMTFGADGSVDAALGTNWTTFNTVTLSRTTTDIYDTSGAVAVAVSAANRGVRNNMAVTPTPNTQYLVTFYAKATVAASGTLRVGFLPAGGTAVPATSQQCVDYSTQSLTDTWTRVTCLVTTPSSGISDPDLVIYQTDATSRTIYIDALTITLNNNNANNVQIGGANKGGPVTLLTLDRASSAPIAANNDAYLGSMYYDTTTGRIQCYEADGWGACGSSPDNIITLTPEYTGAVLNGNGIGVLTADFCANQNSVLTVNTDICTTAGETRNYYRWTSPQASAQTYSIYVNYKLPATFKTFTDDNTIKLTGMTNNTSDGSLSYEIFRKNFASGAISQCGTSTLVTASAGNWIPQSANGNESTSCQWSGGDYLIFKITMSSRNNANVYVENLDFTFTNN